jgi:hypothetical protein
MLEADGSMVMPVFQVAGAEQFRAALDRILHAPWWRQRLDKEPGGGL